jgi:hypothetical protein
MILLEPIIFMLGVSSLAFFWIVINAMTRPIYNKVYDMYHEDEKGRIIANWTIGAMIIVSFLLGYMLG